MSWQRLVWTVKDPNGPEREVRIRDLLARTVYYKGSHHASHNGTPRGVGEDQTGLEQMIHEDLVCVVPVDREMSKKKHWDRTLPWTPLLDRLRERTRGRLILTDTKEEPPRPGNLALLSPSEQKRFAKQVTINDHWVEYIL